MQSKAVQHLIKMGDLEYLRIFIRANPRSLNYLHPPDQFTLLHLLASLGNKTRPVHAKMAEELLVNGADVNCRTDLGWTPTHIIAMQGQKEARDLARLLIAHGADLTAKDRMGFDWKMHWKHGIEIRRELEEAERGVVLTPNSTTGRSNFPNDLVAILTTAVIWWAFEVRTN